MINAEDKLESENPPQNLFGKASISKFSSQSNIEIKHKPDSFKS